MTWGFNFIISFSWLPLVDAFGDTGAFCYYGTWNLIGWVFCYFFLPETKSLTLEELDAVFEVRNRDHAAYYLKKLPWYFKKFVLFQDPAPMPPLYQMDNTPPTGPNNYQMEQFIAPGQEKKSRDLSDRGEATQMENVSDKSL